VGLSQGGKVVSVEPAERTLVTEFGKHKAAVANVIPPQTEAYLMWRARHAHGKSSRQTLMIAVPSLERSYRAIGIVRSGEISAVEADTRRRPYSTSTPNRFAVALVAHVCGASRHDLVRSWHGPGVFGDAANLAAIRGACSVPSTRMACPPVTCAGMLTLIKPFQEQSAYTCTRGR
jgi:hypothetical protein